MGWTSKWCAVHGQYQGKECPKCAALPSKKSKKYGGVSINIPPHMKSVK